MKNSAALEKLVLGILVFTLVFTTRTSSGLPPVLDKQPPSSHKLVESYARLPLRFESDAGQSSLKGQILSRGRGYTLVLTPNEAAFALTTRAAKSAVRPGQESASVQLVRMHLLNADPAARIEALDRLPGVSNYFIGTDPSKWRTNVPGYSKVRYRQVYSGVDLVYYGNQRQLEYDFIVAPGVDPRQIRLKIEGARKLKIDSQGDLVLHTTGGELRFRKPHLYQDLKQGRSEIAGGYALHGAGEVRFAVGPYDTTRPVVIDPQLDYSTFLGGGGDQGNAIALDSAGNAYVTGFTTSTNFPTTTGAFQTSSAGFDDVFVTKLNPTGTALVYSTYLGGSGNDDGNGIAVDSAGNAYVIGSTVSANFPTTAGAFQVAQPSSNQHAFVAKLNSTGTALVYSTYLGGSLDDIGFGIALDASGNAYLTGQTNSTDFPTTTGALQTALGGSTGATDAFVTKLNPTGTALVYSTYLGGSNSETCNSVGCSAIAIDSSGNAYVTGFTSSSDFPTTTGAYQATAPAGINGQAFVSKLNATGTALVYSTFLGGTQGGTTSAIALDGAGNAYVTGTTSSSNFPTTTGASQPTYPGSIFGDGFVTKLNPNGTALVYSTFLGGSGSLSVADNGFGIAVDATGSAYIIGTTASSNFPTTTGAFQTTLNGPQNAFFTKVNASGTALAYSTFLGGNSSNGESGQGIAIDSAGNAYLTGGTSSANFPTTTGAFQTTLQGSGGNAFVAEMTPAGGTAAPAVTLAPPLSFGSVPVGTASASQAITLTNTGNATLNISGITIVGADASDFAQNNNCGSTVTAGAHCTINVTFTPSAVGSRTGSVSVADDAAGSPQTASLSGTGADFALSASPPSDSITKHSTATYTVTVTPAAGGFPNAVTLAASGLPAGAVARFTPSSVTPGGNPANSTLSIDTTGVAALHPAGSGRGLRFLAVVLAPFLLVLPVGLGSRANRRLWMLFLLAVLGVIFLAGCGSNKTQPQGVTATASVFTVTVTGTSGSQQHSTSVTLQLQ